MTAALNAWKQAGSVEFHVPEKFRQEDQAKIIEDFEIYATRRVISATISILEGITPLFKEYCPLENSKIWGFHGERAKEHYIKDMPDGYTAEVYNDAEWDNLKKRLFGLTYLAKLKPALAACISNLETKTTHEKIVQGVLAVLKNAKLFKLDQLDSVLKTFDETFTDPVNKGTNRNHLLLALSYIAINNSITQLRSIECKLENDRSAWDWDQRKIVSIAPK